MADTPKVFERAESFIYRHARPIDLARWQLHFEGGSQKAVLNALQHYQNPDGGFAHALEPDSWNPDSSPIQTWQATEILLEIGFTDPSHPIVEGILRYLEYRQHFDGQVWLSTIPSNDFFPHAPWWSYDVSDDLVPNYNPTVGLVGFAIRVVNTDSSLYNLVTRIAGHACDALLDGRLPTDMHLLACFIRLLDALEEKGPIEEVDTDALREKLQALVKASLEPTEPIEDEDDLLAYWKSGYRAKPSQFFMSKNSAFYHPNRKLAASEVNYILREQEKDGTWPVVWNWPNYPEAWAISRNWWESHIVIQNLRYLQEME